MVKSRSSIVRDRINGCDPSVIWRCKTSLSLLVIVYYGTAINGNWVRVNLFPHCTRMISHCLFNRWPPEEVCRRDRHTSSQWMLRQVFWVSHYATVIWFWTVSNTGGSIRWNASLGPISITVIQCWSYRKQA